VKTPDEETCSRISELEMELSSIARYPQHLELDQTVGPYTLKRIWFDDLDGQPTLGVTYIERSVKNDKKMNIFKSIRIDAPGCLVEAWRKSIFVLVKEICDQGGSQPPKRVQQLTQELQQSDE